METPEQNQAERDSAAKTQVAVDALQVDRDKQYRTADRLMYWFDMGIRLLVLLVAVAIGASLYLIILLGQQNKALNEQNVRIGSRLIDCTTQGHRCYDESNARTNKVIITLNQVTKAAAVCADKPGPISETEMDDCVVNLLSKQPGN
jgi:hypothetical protein